MKSPSTGSGTAQSLPPETIYKRSAGILRRSHIPAFVLSLFVVGLISGCGNILVTDKTPLSQTYPSVQRSSTLTDVPNTQERHDLAVAAVDFDPALDMQQLAAGKPYNLLVAVENKGNRREGPFTVSAQLLSQDQQQVLVSVQRVVQMLAPGDITVVKFINDTTPPLRRAYVLKAQVQSVSREANNNNNQRVLQIDVNTGN